MPSSSNPSRTALGGLYVRKERWSLSWRGRLVGLLLILLAGACYVYGIVPFLCVTDRVETRTMVVEGWIHDFAIRKAIIEFNSGRYEQVYTTGGPVRGGGGYTNDFNTSASVAAERLVKEGLAQNLVLMVPSRVHDRERTYSSAIALRDWLRQNNIKLDHFNIVTESLHARRTRLLYQRAFGESVTIGIIAISEQDYDMSRWWLYSEGVQEVFRESLGYLYAKFLFHPPKS
jgi:DUF218 domain